MPNKPNFQSNSLTLSEVIAGTYNENQPKKRKKNKPKTHQKRTKNERKRMKTNQNEPNSTPKTTPPNPNKTQPKPNFQKDRQPIWPTCFFYLKFLKNNDKIAR
jgi:hypothetical protein